MLHLDPYSSQECASFFLDSGREKIKHAMCALLVEILLPVAAVIKVEASLPVVRKFVSMLYSHCFEFAKRGRHSTVSASLLLPCLLYKLLKMNLVDFLKNVFFPYIMYVQAYIPLVTVLLAISEQQFFLSNWNIFLNQVIMHNIRVSSLSLSLSL